MQHTRIDQIHGILQRKQSASYKELAKMLYTSESTIRRDINKMAQQGLVELVYGGVVLNHSPENLSFQVRKNQQIDKKEIIARKAANIIQDGSTLFLDASSTTLCMLRYLERHHNLRIITNALHGFIEFNYSKFEFFCTGGKFSPQHNAFFGNEAERCLQSFRADYFFFSPDACSVEGEFTMNTREAASLQRVMLANASRSYCLCDSSKIDRNAPFFLCSKENVQEVICDTTLPWEGN